MKNYILGIVTVIFFVAVTPVFAAQTGRLISELDGRNIFGEGVKVSKITDGSNECYIATAVQQTGEMFLQGTMVSISCIKVK